MAKAVEKIQTIHPQGKKAPNIEKAKYDQIHAAIVRVLSENKEIGFSDGLEIVEKWLEGKFDGKIAWYYITVKLDMEAKGELIRLPELGKNGQQMMRKA
jgi:hypothetical protein